jgi:outer membrane protein
MKQFFVLLAASALIYSFTAAQAQTNQAKSLTLEQALSVAFERNVTVAQSANSIDNAKYSVLSAYGSYIPRLSASASYNRTGFSTPASVRTIGGVPFTVLRTDTYYNTYNGSIGLSYTLFDGFSRESSFSTAQTNEMSAEQTYDRTRQSIANSVISSYLNVLRNEQQVNVLKQNLTNEKNRLDRITEQNRLGAVAIGDVYREQSLVAQAEYNLISGQNTYDKSKADLLNLLALDVNQDYTIADQTIATQIKQVETDPGVQAMGTYDELLKRALDARPDYAVVKSSVTLADLGVTSAWSGYYPSVSASAGYSTNAQVWSKASSWDNHSTNLGFTVSWQLPEIFGAIQRIQSANISKKNAVLQLEQKQRDISVEIKKALLDLDAGQKQYIASQKSQIAAEQDRKIAEAKYNLGSGTLLDLQVASTTYLNAQLTTVFNAYNYYTLKKNLELVIGEKKY